MWGFCLIGALAAFGTVCALWTLFGLGLPRDEGKLYYAGPEPVEFARRYLWLKQMGLLRCPLTVIDPGKQALEWLRDRGVEGWDREEHTREQMGEKDFDGRTGDFAGNHRSGGISEL